MGQVYLAEQLEPVHREVALKLMGQKLSGPRAEIRFEIERQALARMHHPAIAQVYEASATDEGFPWLAMEYIPGLPIDEYCRTHALPLEGRLTLFRQVLLGVRHAHDRGILHLDIKPANLLVAEVDGQARPKIIDFGLAVSATRPGGKGRPTMQAGTPGYMSPEQAGRDDGDEALPDVDVRSDVHALGAVLYQLITDSPPWPNAAFAPATAETIRRVYREQRPVPASERLRKAGRHAWARKVRGDLEAIAQRAMAFVRQDRYESVGEFLDDLDRYLGTRPVRARDGGAVHRAGLYFARHRTALTLAALLTLMLAAGLLVAWWGLLEARNERDLAEQRQQETERVLQFQQSMLRDIDPAQLGQRLREYLPAGQVAELPQQDYTEAARRLIGEAILERAAEAISRDFVDQPILAAELWRALSMSQRALGRHAAMRDTAREGLAALAAAGLGPTDERALRLRVLEARALIAAGQGREHLQAVESLVREAAAQGQPVISLEAELLAVEIAGLEAGKLESSIERVERIVAAQRELKDVPPLQNLVARQTWVRLLMRARRTEQALPELEAIHAEMVALSGADHVRSKKALEELAIGLGLSGRHEEALPLFEDVYQWRRERQGAQHPDTLSALNGIAVTYNGLKRWDEAIAITREGLAARKALLGPEHPQTLRSMLNLGSMLASVDQIDEALALTRECYAARLRTLGPDNPDVYTAAQNLADFEIIAGDHAEGLRLARLVQSERSRLLPADHIEVRNAAPLLARALAAGGEHAEAIPALEAEIAANPEPDNPVHQRRRGLAAWHLAQSLRALGRDQDADALLSEHMPPLLAQPWLHLNPPERHARRQYEAWLGGR